MPPGAGDISELAFWPPIWLSDLSENRAGSRPTTFSHIWGQVPEAPRLKVCGVSVRTHCDRGAPGDFLQAPFETHVCYNAYVLAFPSPSAYALRICAAHPLDVVIVNFGNRSTLQLRSIKMHQKTYTHDYINNDACVCRICEPAGRRLSMHILPK